MTPNQKTLTGIISGITFKNEVTGHCVLRLATSKGPVKAVGTLHEIAKGTDVLDLEFEFHGSWKNSKWGVQFEFQSYAMLTNDMLYFLAKFIKGLGPKTARLVLAEIPADQLGGVLDRAPEKLLSIKGIGKKKLDMITASWPKFKHLRVLTDFFAEKGVQISTYLVVAIERHFGDDAKAIIEENPYRLTEIKRVGFKTADKLALKLGVEKNSFHRMVAAIDYAVLKDTEDNGNTLTKLDRLYDAMLELFDNDIDDAVYRKALQKKVADGELYFNTAIKAVGLMAVRRREEAIGRFITGNRTKAALPESLVTKFIDKVEAERRIKFSTLQKKFFYDLAGDQLTLGVFGYAGTGKTTSCRTGLEFLSQYFCSKDEIVGAAFTGMAATRFKAVTGFNAFTIHSLLKFQNGEFYYGKTRKLPYRVIVLDEAAMVDLKLIKSLIDAIDERALFLLVGDPAQLEPIGAGKAFADLIANGFLKATGLTEIYRNSADSVLTYFASFMRKGELPPEVYKTGWKDFEFVDVEPRAIYQLRGQGASELELKEARDQNNLAILGKVLKSAIVAYQRYDDPTYDVQVLTQMRSGILGVENLNVELQKVLNPSIHGKTEAQIGPKILRLDDKVIHLENQNMEIFTQTASGHIMPAPNFDLDVRVCNGSLGNVIRIDKELETFFVKHFDGRIVKYTFDDYGQIIDLAYAKTVHKAQGSQYKEVIIPMTTSHWGMLNCQQLYTGTTRASDFIRFIGQKRAFKRACTNIEDTFRLTNLSIIKTVSELTDTEPLTEKLRVLTECLEKPRDAETTAADEPVQEVKTITQRLIAKL